MPRKHSSDRFAPHREQGGFFFNTGPYLLGLLLGAAMFGFLYVAYAKAETGVRVLYLTGDGAVSRQQLDEALYVTALKLKLAGKPIRIMKVITKPNTCENALEGFPSQYNCFKGLADNLRRFKNGPTLVVSPPIKGSDGVAYLGGAARIDCIRNASRRVSWFAASSNVSAYRNAVGCSHELGHSFGASHVTDESVMNTLALGISKYNLILNFSTESVNQLRQCRNRGAF